MIRCLSPFECDPNNISYLDNRRPAWQSILTISCIAAGIFCTLVALSAPLAGTAALYFTGHSNTALTPLAACFIPALLFGMSYSIYSCCRGQRSYSLIY